MRKLTQTIAEYSGGHGDSGNISEKDQGAEDKRNAYAGLLLKNLVGNYGTVEGTKYLMSTASGGKMNEYVEQHLGTLNHLRANTLGLDTYRDNVMGYRFREEDWRSFDSEMAEYGVKVHEGGALVPRDADKSVKDKAQAEFQKKKGETEEWEAAQVEVEKTQLSESIKALEDEVSELEQKKERTEDAWKMMSRAQDEMYIFDQKDAQAKLDEVNKEVENLEANQVLTKAELQGLGFFSWGRKKKLSEQIVTRELQLNKADTGARGRQRYLEQLVKANDVFNERDRDGVETLNRAQRQTGGKESPPGRSEQIEAQKGSASVRHVDL